MEGQRQSFSPVVFGPFEVDILSQSLRKSGYPVRLAGQPFDILVTLMETPGEPVSRDQLRERIWPDGTFVDFEHGLNAAINRLRRALDDSAEKPRYIETVPGRGYRFIGLIEQPVPAMDGPAAAEPVSVAPAVVPLPQATTEVIEARVEVSRGRRRWLWLVIPAACAAAALFFREIPQRRPPSPVKVTQVTSADGVSWSPAISADGRMVAYSSDGGEDKGGDLYIKAVSGGKPVRLTFDNADNITPDFSPDGSHIVFRSSREGGGIFEIPSLGGPVQLIARDGYNPRFSPDGKQLAYWVGSRSVAAVIPGASQVWVVPAIGGTPHRVNSGLSTANNPVWTRDGKYLLVEGYSSEKTYQPDALDWWLLPVDGGQPVRTGAREAMLHAGLPLLGNMTTPIPAMPVPGCWSSDGHMLFSTRNGDSENLWQIGLSAQAGGAISLPERLTTGAGVEKEPSCAGSNVVFSSQERRTDIWLFPLDKRGDGQQLSHGPGVRESLNITRNGRFLAFASDRAETPNVWLRDLSTGNESLVASSPLVERYPLSNESGTRVLYSVYEQGKRVLYASTKGGATERLCEGCLRPTDWTQDENKVIVFGGSPYTINVLDLVSREQTVLVRHPNNSVLYGRFSPDFRWISFTERVSPSVGRIVIAPLDGLKPVSEASWITVAEAGIDDYAMWSSDGRTLYYTSPRDGRDCVWGQTVDRTTGRPLGEPFGVRHFHGHQFFSHMGWSAGNGMLAIPLTEATGGVWLLSR